jgi:hypothetical protein
MKTLMISAGCLVFLVVLFLLMSGNEATLSWDVLVPEKKESLEERIMNDPAIIRELEFAREEKESRERSEEVSAE